MEYYNTGEAIAGLSCDLYTRRADVKNKGLQQNPVTKKPCIRIEMSRNSSAQISKTFDEKEASDPKWKGVHLEHGDKLKADAITVYVDQKTTVIFDCSEGATATHGGNFASTSNTTYCKIKYPYEHLQYVFQKTLVNPQNKIESK